MTVALEAYLEPSETSTKQLFCVNNYIIILQENSMVNFRLGSKYVSAAQ